MTIDSLEIVKEPFSEILLRLIVKRKKNSKISVNNKFKFILAKPFEENK